jgi:soluble cytochrome b562
MGERLDTISGISADTNKSEDIALDSEWEPLEEICIQEIPVSEQELAQLLIELDALELKPLEENEAHADTLIDYDEVFEGLDSYDFDGKDFNQDTEWLSTVLDGFQEDNWSNMDLPSQKEQILEMLDYASNVIGLEKPPDIEYYCEATPWDYGGYSPETNTLQINEYMLKDSNEAADTVAHELWHAYQHERASNPKSPKDFQYQFGFENYINPFDDFDAYQNQLVEAEARAFADQFKGLLEQMKGSY